MKRVLEIFLISFFLLALGTFFRMSVPNVAIAAPNMCCPVGYENGDLSCPFGVDQTKQCCKRYGLFNYGVVDKISCTASPPPEANLCCPSGFSTGDSDCPFGIDRNKQCCKRFGLANYQVVNKVTCGTTSPSDLNMCCPVGFINGDFACPFGVDQVKQCCKRYDFGNYDIVDKAQCGTGSITGNYCCPDGYGIGLLDCPAGTDVSKQCCKRLAFGQYEKVDKISCTIPAGTENLPSPTPPPPPCSKWIDPKTGAPVPSNSPIVSEGKATCESIKTGLGDISTNPAGFIKSVFVILLSLAGGVALILIIISGYRLMTSQGNPEKVQAAREQLTSAIVGLLFIIFSLAILQIIGVDILHIPGFR